MMAIYHPRAISAPANLAGLSVLDYPPKIVLHTTESSTYSYNPSSYYGNPYWPHATIDTRGIHQHLPIDVGAYALYHGSVDTNRANAIQCEIVWYAGDIETAPDRLLTHVADWITWVSAETRAPLTVCPQGFHGPGEGFTLATEFSPIRFSDDAWLAFSGVCGHQHVPSGNDHWDPGAFPFARTLALTGDDDMTDAEHRLLQDAADKATFAANFCESLNKRLFLPLGDGDGNRGLATLVRVIAWLDSQRDQAEHQA